MKHRWYDRDIIDPKEKEDRIKDKADIEAICLEAKSIGVTPKAKKTDFAKCNNCGETLECVIGSCSLYECSNCGCMWECKGSYQNTLLWLCVFDPQQGGEKGTG